MSEQKPNHICKNPECRKHYYACDRCDKIQSWRSVACSVECYKKYTDLVIEARTKGKNIISKPERTDMTESEIDALLNKSMEEVLEDSTSSNSNDNNEENIDLESDKININSNKRKKTSTRSRKNVSNDE